MAEDSHANEDTTPDKKPPRFHPVGRIIREYTDRIRAIRLCAIEYVGLATKKGILLEKALFDRIKEAADRLKGILERGNPTEEDRQWCYETFLNPKVTDDFEHHFAAPHSELLSESLLILGFSTFDAAVGRLLVQLYREQPGLVHSLEEKTIKAADFVDCQTIQEATDKLFEREASRLLRENYDEIFSVLERRHEISTLKGFPAWPKFIEAAQRRNLVTHCGGVVNEQYRAVCKRAGVVLGADADFGKKLRVDEAYLLSALDVLYEVGLKLGIVLWRKLSPDFAGAAEEFLSDETFELARRGEWGLAISVGEFVFKYIKKPNNELVNRIALLNYAQSLKWSGQDAAARDVIASADWSATMDDLQLGVAVLIENYDDAADLMRRIGREGRLIVETGYRIWPIFRKFRKTPQFKKAFQDVYGKEFSTGVMQQGLFCDKSQDGAVELPQSGTEVASPTPGEPTMPPYKPTEEEQRQQEAEFENQGNG
jgi:hypothetical protein